MKGAREPKGASSGADVGPSQEPETARERRVTSRDTRIVASDAGGAGFFFFVAPPPKIRKPASAFGVSESFVSDVKSATSRPKAFAPALFCAPEKRAIRPKASTRGFVFVFVSVFRVASRLERRRPAGHESTVAPRSANELGDGDGGARRRADVR
jgi:hypothetical protein